MSPDPRERTQQAGNPAPPEGSGGDACDSGGRGGGGRGGDGATASNSVRGANGLRSLVPPGTHPKHALGQHFVVDPNTLRRIVNLAYVRQGDRVLEVGPGTGALTRALLDAEADVTAVELDRALLRRLRENEDFARVRFVEGDAMRLPIEELLACSDAILSPESPPMTNLEPPNHTGPDRLAGDLPRFRGNASGLRPSRDRSERPSGNSTPAPPPGNPSRQGSWKLVSNLPYSIAAPLIIRVLGEVPSIGMMVVMVQREVAERLAAARGSPAFGAAATMVSLLGSARVVGQVSRSVFLPRPGVDSSLLEVRRLSDDLSIDPSGDEYATVVTLLKRAYSTRRKMLRRSLSGLVDERCYEEACVPGSSRPEELDVEDWRRLAVAWTRAESGQESGQGRGTCPA